jgi:hypothetical protein
MQSAQPEVKRARPRGHASGLLRVVLVVVAVGLLMYAAGLYVEATRSVDDSDAAANAGLALLFGGPALLTLALMAASVALRNVTRPWVDRVSTALQVASAVSCLTPVLIGAGVYVALNI